MVQSRNPQRRNFTALCALKAVSDRHVHQIPEQPASNFKLLLMDLSNVCLTPGGRRQTVKRSQKKNPNRLKVTEVTAVNAAPSNKRVEIGGDKQEVINRRWSALLPALPPAAPSWFCSLPLWTFSEDEEKKSGRWTVPEQRPGSFSLLPVNVFTS